MSYELFRMVKKLEIRKCKLVIYVIIVSVITMSYCF
jgi:hypothetical protein